MAVDHRSWDVSGVHRRWPPSSSSPDPETDAAGAAVPLLDCQYLLSKLGQDLHLLRQTSLEIPGHGRSTSARWVSRAVCNLWGVNSVCGHRNACRLDMSCCLERAY